MGAVEMGQRIRTQRGKLAMRQSDLAAKTGLSQAYISRLEKGAAGDNIDDLLNVARALGCRLSYLVGETEGELLAEVQHKLPTGATVSVSFERLSPGSDPAGDQTFIDAAVAAVMARLEPQSET